MMQLDPTRVAKTSYRHGWLIIARYSRSPKNEEDLDRCHFGYFIGQLKIALGLIRSTIDASLFPAIEIFHFWIGLAYGSLSAAKLNANSF